MELKLVRFNRPKLPRNRFGINNKNGFFIGGVISEDGSLNVKYDDEYTTNTETTIVNNNIINTEWYNIQNKIYHSYKDLTDADGKYVYTQATDEQGRPMYNSNGEPIMTTRKSYTGSTWITTIENFDNENELRNSDKYRFFLVRFRKNYREGKRWRVPFFSNRYRRTGDGVETLHMTIAEQDCWWPVKGAETKWWNSSQIYVKTETAEDGTTTDIYRNKDYTDVLPVSGDHIKSKKCFDYINKTATLSDGSTISYVQQITTYKDVFKNSKSRKMTVGCALFKKDDCGSYGWRQVSNIAKIDLFLSENGGITVVPNR